MMPLLIALVTALLNGIEHSDKQWKHLFALPVPPMNIFIEGRCVMALVLGIGGGLVTALLGCFEFVRRDVA